MGMYNTVFIPCAHCGHEDEAQSKAGTCNLTEKSIYDGDISDVADQHNYSWVCQKCKNESRVIVQTIVYVVRDNDEDRDTAALRPFGVAPPTEWDDEANDISS